MQEPTEEAEEVEAPIPTEIVSSSPNRPNLNATPAKRTVPWELAAGELDLVLPQPQAEDIPARKKRRLEEPLSITTDEAARKTALPDVSVDLPPSAVGNDDNDVILDPVKDAQPNTVATGAIGLWTTDEDARLTSAVANTSKKKHGKEHKTDWVTISALVPGRTRGQRSQR
jgi:hypothetical protein